MMPISARASSSKPRSQSFFCWFRVAYRVKKQQTPNSYFNKQTVWHG